MMKKIIMTSVLGISALALVNANAEVAPATAPGAKSLHAKKHHHSKKHMKSAKTEATPSTMPAEDMSAATVPAQPVSNLGHHALPAGLYVGAQAGYADSVSPLADANSNPIPQVNNKGLAGRLSIGYQLNKNFAVEAGYLSLHETQFAGEKGSKLVNQQNVIDIAGKGSYPIADRISVYGKAGIAYVTTSYDLKQGPATVQFNNVYGVARHKFAPEVAVGMNFDVTSNVAVDTSLTHIHPFGSNRPGNINYLAVGVHYTFG